MSFQEPPGRDKWGVNTGIKERLHFSATEGAGGNFLSKSLEQPGPCGLWVGASDLQNYGTVHFCCKPTGLWQFIPGTLGNLIKWLCDLRYITAFFRITLRWCGRWGLAHLVWKVVKNKPNYKFNSLCVEDTQMIVDYAAFNTNNFLKMEESW